MRSGATRTLAVAFACLVTCVLAACGGRSRTAAPERAVLQPTGGVTVARVGGETITADDVRAIARAESITDPRAALDRAIELRLMAREAVRRGLDRDPLVRELARRAAVQSLLAHTVEQTVRRDNLPSRDLEAGLRIRGFEIAHGPLWRTIHALVRVPEHATAEQRTALHARAEAIREAVAALPAPRSEDAFRAAVRRVAGESEARIEDLPAIDAHGRFANGDMVPPFTTAATALEHVGDVSDVVETPFGYHVILLVERVPALERPEQEVRAIVADELLWRLRHTELERMLAQLRAAYHTTIRDEALQRVGTAPVVPQREHGGGP